MLYPNLDTSTTSTSTITERANGATLVLEGVKTTDFLAVPITTAPLLSSSSSCFVSPSDSDNDTSGSVAVVSMDLETSSCSSSSSSYDADPDHRYHCYRSWRSRALSSLSLPPSFSTARTSETFRSATTFDHDHGFLGKNYCYNNASNTNNGIVEQYQEQPRREQPLRTTTALHAQHHPETRAMKRHRRHTRATYGMAGAVVGTMVLPLVGTIVGGCLAGYSANLVLKRRERCIKRKWERDSFQAHADESPAARHAVFV